MIVCAGVRGILLHSIRTSRGECWLSSVGLATWNSASLDAVSSLGKGRCVSLWVALPALKCLHAPAGGVSREVNL